LEECEDRGTVSNEKAMEEDFEECLQSNSKENWQNDQNKGNQDVCQLSSQDSSQFNPNSPKGNDNKSKVCRKRSRKAVNKRKNKANDLQDKLTPVPKKSQVTVRFAEQEKLGCMSAKRPHLEVIDENIEAEGGIFDEETLEFNNNFNYNDDCDELQMGKNNSLDYIRLTNKKKQYLQDAIIDKNGAYSFLEDPVEYKKARKRL
jgi:hypothetical protein